jgi:hypothetical protein
VETQSTTYKQEPLLSNYLKAGLAQFAERRKASLQNGNRKVIIAKTQAIYTFLAGLENFISFLKATVFWI